jgi:predicted transglutaminase-like cysteine proteinase
VGDCDDYVVLLGSLYYDLGWGVTLVNVVQDGTDQEHVYLRVTTPDGVFAADAIIREPFGWELPPEERLSEAVVVV